MELCSILSTLFNWICKGIACLMLISLIIFFVDFVRLLITNGGRKWYYYNSSKPWKGGYWSPMLPDYPPYNNYKWNPETCRFEHKMTGAPLYPGQKAYRPADVSRTKIIKPKKDRPEWLRFLLDETPASLYEKHKRKK